MIRHDDQDSLYRWIDTYQLRHDISEETAAFYRRSIATFERWTGCVLGPETCDETVVNSGLKRMIDAGRSPHYVRSVRTGVLTIWRDMADAGRCGPPGRIRPVRLGVPIVEVWSPEDVGRLVAAAGELHGTFRTTGLDRATYWETLIRTAWDTALRRRDLQQLRRRQVGLEWVHWQHKTHKPLRVRLRASTLEAIDRWHRHQDAVLWPPWGTDEAFRAAFRRIVSAAGIAAGPWKRIRKSAGTAAERCCPGTGHLLLGNTRAVFERHYLDVAAVVGPQPPELD